MGKIAKLYGKYFVNSPFSPEEEIYPITSAVGVYNTDGNNIATTINNSSGNSSSVVGNYVPLIQGYAQAGGFKIPTLSNPSQYILMADGGAKTPEQLGLTGGNNGSGVPSNVTAETVKGWLRLVLGNSAGGSTKGIYWTGDGFSETNPIPISSSEQTTWENIQRSTILSNLGLADGTTAGENAGLYWNGSALTPVISSSTPGTVDKTQVLSWLGLNSDSDSISGSSASKPVYWNNTSGKFAVANSIPAGLIRSGNDDPANGTGTEGDFYLDTRNGDVWVCYGNPASWHKLDLGGNQTVLRFIGVSAGAPSNPQSGDVYIDSNDGGKIKVYYNGNSQDTGQVITGSGNGVSIQAGGRTYSSGETVTLAAGTGISISSNGSGTITIENTGSNAGTISPATPNTLGGIKTTRPTQGLGLYAYPTINYSGVKSSKDVELAEDIIQDFTDDYPAFDADSIISYDINGETVTLNKTERRQLLDTILYDIYHYRTSGNNVVDTSNNTVNMTDANWRYLINNYAGTGANYGVQTDPNGRAFVNIPNATAGGYGVFKIFNTYVGDITAATSLWNNINNTTGKCYGVQIDSNGKAFVNVPWTDTDTNTTYKLTLNGTVNGAANGTELGTFYAPTSLGTVGQVLKVNNARNGVEWGDATSTAIGAATSSNYGGIKIGYSTSASDRNYAVLLDDGKAYVNVPWVSGEGDGAVNSVTYANGSHLGVNSNTGDVVIKVENGYEIPSTIRTAAWDAMSSSSLPNATGQAGKYLTVVESQDGQGDYNYTPTWTSNLELDGNIYLDDHSIYLYDKQQPNILYDSQFGFILSAPAQGITVKDAQSQDIANFNTNVVDIETNISSGGVIADHNYETGKLTISGMAAIWKIKNNQSDVICPGTYVSGFTYETKENYVLISQTLPNSIAGITNPKLSRSDSSDDYNYQIYYKGSQISSSNLLVNRSWSFVYKGNRFDAIEINLVSAYDLARNNTINYVFDGVEYYFKSSVFNNLVVTGEFNDGKLCTLVNETLFYNAYIAQNNVYVDILLPSNIATGENAKAYIEARYDDLGVYVAKNADGSEPYTDISALLNTAPNNTTTESYAGQTWCKITTNTTVNGTVTTSETYYIVVVGKKKGQKTVNKKIFEITVS